MILFQFMVFNKHACTTDYLSVFGFFLYSRKKELQHRRIAALLYRVPFIIYLEYIFITLPELVNLIGMVMHRFESVESILPQYSVTPE